MFFSLYLCRAAVELGLVIFDSYEVWTKMAANFNSVHSGNCACYAQLAYIVWKYALPSGTRPLLVIDKYYSEEHNLIKDE